MGGVPFGTLFFAVMDEGANTAPGLVGDNRKYPAEAHLRGWASHVAFGVAAAAVARVFGIAGNKRRGDMGALTL